MRPVASARGTGMSRATPNRPQDYCGEYIVVSHAWRRDIRRAADLQQNPEMRDPFALLARPVAHNLSGRWRVECGLPSLVFDSNQIHIQKIVKADRFIWLHQFESGAPWWHMARLSRQILLAEGVIAIFDCLCQLDGAND